MFTSLKSHTYSNRNNFYRNSAKTVITTNDFTLQHEIMRYAITVITTNDFTVSHETMRYAITVITTNDFTVPNKTMRYAQ